MASRSRNVILMKTKHVEHGEERGKIWICPCIQIINDEKGDDDDDDEKGDDDKNREGGAQLQLLLGRPLGSFQLVNC